MTYFCAASVMELIGLTSDFLIRITMIEAIRAVTMNIASVICSTNERAFVRMISTETSASR